MPPNCLITSTPGCKVKWNVFTNAICVPISLRSLGGMVFSVPFVATGTNAGVKTSPCGVWRIPVLAFDFLLLFMISKNGISKSISQKRKSGLDSWSQPQPLTEILNTVLHEHQLFLHYLLIPHQEAPQKERFYAQDAKRVHVVLIPAACSGYLSRRS